jgi:hypothetical protein
VPAAMPRVKRTLTAWAFPSVLSVHWNVLKASILSILMYTWLRLTRCLKVPQLGLGRAEAGTESAWNFDTVSLYAIPF